MYPSSLDSFHLWRSLSKRIRVQMKLCKKNSFDVCSFWSHYHRDSYKTLIICAKKTFNQFRAGIGYSKQLSYISSH